jgi:hypothetical protein
VAVALLANIFRSSFLVWMAARHGLAALERVHDATGLTVLVIVFGALVGLNAALAKRPAAPREQTSAPREIGSIALPARWAVFAIVVWLAAIELGNLWWYRMPSAQPLETQPRWTVTAPAGAPDFQSLPIDARTAQMLRYDHAMSLRWNRPDDGGVSKDDCNLYFFRWDAGHASGLQADLHQPHICLTASGLTETADWGIRPLALENGLTLPVRRYEFNFHGRPLYVFFVVWQDGVSGGANTDEPGSRAARLRAVLERRPIVGRQTLEFLVAGPSTAEAAEALFQREMISLVHRES